jgi:hypothetical protein
VQLPQSGAYLQIAVVGGGLRASEGQDYRGPLQDDTQTRHTLTCSEKQDHFNPTEPGQAQARPSSFSLETSRAAPHIDPNTFLKV